MRKLRLSIDGLRVESFDTQSPERPVGTVVGRDASEEGTCTGYQYTCAPCDNSQLDACGTGGHAGVGVSCASTCMQAICGCTAGGYMNGTCDYSCESCECNTDVTCWTICTVGCG